MQVFVPVPDVRKSLVALDKRRLAKQRVEAKQLIDTILDRPTASGKKRTGWYNHPAAVMFRQYLPFLIHYYNSSLVVHELINGGKNVKLQPEPLENDVVYPHWWGEEAIHASHRGRLLFKGKLDVLADRIKLYTGDRGANRWLKEHGFGELNVLRQPEYDAISSILDAAGAEQSTKTNHYLQFSWTESDQLEYVWPGENIGDKNRMVRQ